MHKFKRDLTALSVAIGNGMVLRGRAAIRRQFAMVRKGEEVMDEDLFHKKTLAAAGGTTEVRFFSSDIGSLHLTNMEEANKIGADKDFLVEALEIVPVAAAATEANRLLDLNELLNVGMLTIEYKGQLVHRGGPLRRYVGNKALLGVDTTNGASTDEPFILANPILLEEGINFKCKVEFPASGGSPALTADVDLTMIFHGQTIKAETAQ